MSHIQENETERLKVIPDLSPFAGHLDYYSFRNQGAWP